MAIIGMTEADLQAANRSKPCTYCGVEFYCPYGIGVGVWSKRKYCSTVCSGMAQRKRTQKICPICKSKFEVNRDRIFLCSKACANKFLSVNYRGENHPLYKGNKRLRETVQYKEWRDAIFKRDNYTCQECGDRGVKLNADHIKPFAYYPELRFSLDNGRTLCVDCHQKTDSFGLKAIINYRKEEAWL